MGAGVALVLGGMTMALTPEPPPETPRALTYTTDFSIPWLPDTVQHWRSLIVEMAQRYDLDPNLVAIIITIESGGFSGASSEASAQGLMQITPAAAQDISRRYLKQPRTEYDVADPATNVEFGTAFLSHLRDQFAEPWPDYTVELVAAGYNGGPGSAGRLWRGEGQPSSENVSYSRDVMNMWRERNSATSPTFERWVERGGFRLIDRARAEQAGQ